MAAGLRHLRGRRDARPREEAARVPQLRAQSVLGGEGGGGAATLRDEGEIVVKKKEPA